MRKHLVPLRCISAGTAAGKSTQVVPSADRAVQAGLSNRTKACPSAGARTIERSFLSYLPLLAPCLVMSKPSRKGRTDRVVATLTCPGPPWSALSLFAVVLRMLLELLC